MATADGEQCFPRNKQPSVYGMAWLTLQDPWPIETVLHLNMVIMSDVILEVYLSCH